jgi:hypothetical protein
MLEVKISISSAYFSTVETMADFFNSIGRLLPFTKGRYIGSFSADRHRQKPTDSVEKVGFLKVPEYWSVKMPFLHAAPSNPSPKTSVYSMDFNLRRVLSDV